MKFYWKKKSILPGFGASLGFTLLYLTILVLIPLSAAVIKAADLGAVEFWRLATDARVMASFRLSFGASFAAAVVNVFFGTLTAWVLVRYSFPGKKIIDALVDLPFALPTAVSGITLTALYAPNGWLGKPLNELGIKVAYTPLGIVMALIFTGLPFVVRSVQPVLEDLDREVEEAASGLGATRWQTWVKVIFPSLKPAILTGFTMAFARCVGEYGSVVFIAGNMPMMTEITPLLIITKLEQYDYAGATAIAALMLMISFVLLLLINFLQWRSRRYEF
jgi:sulfate transport system permease protein